MAIDDSIHDQVVSILCFRPDGTVEELDVVDVDAHDQVLLVDAPRLGTVLVVGDPEAAVLRSAVERLSARSGFESA